MTRQHALLFCALCDAQACIAPCRRPECHRLLLRTLLAWAAAETPFAAETRQLYFAMDFSLHKLINKVSYLLLHQAVDFLQLLPACMQGTCSACNISTC